MRRTLSKMSQGAVHSRTKQKCNKRLNSRLRHCFRLIGSEFHSRGPRSCEASVAEDVGREACDTGRCMSVGLDTLDVDSTTCSVEPLPTVFKSVRTAIQAFESATFSSD